MEASTVGSCLSNDPNMPISGSRKIADFRMHPRALGEAFRISSTQHFPLILFLQPVFRIQKLCKFSPVIQTEMQKIQAKKHGDAAIE